MRRTTPALLWIVVVSLARPTAAWAAEPERPRPVFGTVISATADSIVVSAKPPPPRRARPGEAPKPEATPVEHTFAVAKDQTEFVFAELVREMMFADGTVGRTYRTDEPATAADLKPGASVDVTAREGVASRVIIPWGVTGVLVKVAADSVTFRPQPPDGAAGDVPEEQTLKAADGTTKVRLEVVVAEQRNAGGRVFGRSVRYQHGTLADLQAGQRVVMCARDGTAARIRVLPPEPPAQGVN